MGLALSANIRMQMNLQLENSKILSSVPVEAGEIFFLSISFFLSFPVSIVDLVCKEELNLMLMLVKVRLA